MWAKRAATTTSGSDTARAATPAPNAAAPPASAVSLSKLASASRFAPRRAVAAAQPAVAPPANVSTTKGTMRTVPLLPAPSSSSMPTATSLFAPRRSTTAAAPPPANAKPNIAVTNATPTHTKPSLFASRRAAANGSAQQTATSARSTPAPGASTAPTDDADVRWLLRAVERKKQTKSKAKPLDAATIASAGAPARTYTATTRLLPSASASATVAVSTAAATKKRKASAIGTDTGTTTGISIPTLSSWKKRQQAWHNPAATTASSTANATTEHDARVYESEQLESFDQVFLEVFGRQQHAAAVATIGSAQYAPGALSDTTPTASTATATASNEPSDAVRTTTNSSSMHSATGSIDTTSTVPEASAWRFATPSTAASSTISCLSDFELPSAASTTNAAPTTADASAFARYKDSNTQQRVSDNFVKLHMRKRVRGSSGRAKKRPEYLRGRFAVPSIDMIDGGSSTNDAFMDPIAVQANAKARTNNSVEPPLTGAMHDGIDFIEECLEVLARVEAQRAIGGTTNAGASTTTDVALTEPVAPPRCHHALICSRVIVKKKNKNHNRVFFSCPLRFDEGRCEFFLWEDNHAQLALQTLFAPVDATSSSDVEPTAFVPLDLSQSFDTQSDALVTNLRLVFGHAAFRAGQQWAIERILHQQSTLLVLPTGAGKSLCYQYPALFLPGVTLVISPLISLMNDQFANLPPLLQTRAVCLTSAASSSKTAYATFVRNLLGGQLKLVFLSPERAVSNGFQQLLTQLRHRISLVCVDEAHCVSEWSHHFRPSYLRLQNVFQYAQCVLAITATASTRVIHDIVAQIKEKRRSDVGGGQCGTNNISTDNNGTSDSHTNSMGTNGIDTKDADTSVDTTSDSDMVLQMPWQRSNLMLQVRRVDSNDERIADLVQFLSTTKLPGGIIMYVHQQRHAEDMAAVLKDQLPGAAWQRKIAFYHARMDADAKEKVRIGFLSGRVRVVIATIAFGMGIDKQNVRCVIHFHMPSSVENYLQQIGRAGRDGKKAIGLLYLLPDDVVTFRSLAFSNAFDITQLRKLVERLVFAGLDDKEVEENTGMDTGIANDLTDTTYRDHIVAVSTSDQEDDNRQQQLHVSLEIEWLETFVDMKAATIETFVTLLALETTRFEPNEAVTTGNSPLCVQLLPSSMSTCVLHVVERKFTDAAVDSTLQRIVHALLASSDDESSTYKLHGSVTTETNGYLTTLVVEFHVREMAERLFGAELRAAARVAPPLLGGSSDIGGSSSSSCERRLLQHVRRMQQDGLIQRFTLEKFAFQVALQWASAVSTTNRDALVEMWTQQLYAKHLALETMEVERLTRLYGALHAASLPCTRRSRHRSVELKIPSITHDAKSDDSDNSDSDSNDALAVQARVLEDRLVAYFAHDRVSPADTQLMKLLLVPLTPQAIAAIEHDVQSVVDLAVSDDPDEETDNTGFSTGIDVFATQRFSGGNKSKSKQKRKQPPSASAQRALAARKQQLARTQWTCYSVAKLFHGLASPCFPLLKWRDHASWKKYDRVAFEQLVRIADKVLKERESSGDGNSREIADVCNL